MVRPFTVVSITAGNWLDGSRFESHQVQRISLLQKLSRSAMGSDLFSIRSVTWSLFSEVKGQGFEANHSHPSTAEVGIEWRFSSVPPLMPS